MDRSRIRRGIAVVILLLMFHIGPLISRNPISADSPDPMLSPRFASSAAIDVNYELERLFDEVNTTKLSDMVKTLSEEYPYRVWFPMRKGPSEPLADAWTYANQTLMTETGGAMSFRLTTDYQTLVSIKPGSLPNHAPIVIAGVISSLYSPGANGYGASAAAVIEAARVLKSASLTNDVMFVLLNTIPSFGQDSNGNYGMRYLIENLSIRGETPAAVFWFSNLLYESAEEQGNYVAMTTVHPSGLFGPTNLVVNLASKASRYAGANIYSTIPASSVFWSRSGAYDAALEGIPAFSLSQVYSDPYSGSEYDTWDVAGYSYTQLKEAVGLVTAMAWTLGRLGSGDLFQYDGPLFVSEGAEQMISLPATADCNVTVNVHWNTGENLTIRILSPQGIVLQETSCNSTVTLTRRIASPGLYYFSVVNPGLTDVVVGFRYSMPQDFDQDTLDDEEELLFDSDTLCSDTDRDLLSDDLEQEYGTDPRVQDSDADGAWDGTEVQIGSDPTVYDTDNDTLSDGFEIAYGISPVDSDSDDDGLADNIELELGTDPSDQDSDGDGLDDFDEIQKGCNPLSRDTDGDGLNDLFEVVNGLNPNLNDSDGDSLGDLYEIENGLNPLTSDTDGDWLLDPADWDPRVHWIWSVPYLVIGVVGVALAAWLLKKKRKYDRGASD